MDSSVEFAAQKFGRMRSVQHDSVITVSTLLTATTITVDHITAQGVVLRFTATSRYSARATQVNWGVIRPEGDGLIDWWPSRQAARAAIAS
jgi:hypothetical protein